MNAGPPDARITHPISHLCHVTVTALPPRRPRAAVCVIIPLDDDAAAEPRDAIAPRHAMAGERGNFECAWNKTCVASVYLMMTNGTRENVQREIVELLPRLRRFARNLTRNPHDADDVVQIAVERALTRISQWRQDTRLDGWMFKIVKNAWIDEVRSRKRHAEILLADDTAATEAAGSQEHVLSIHAAMARLPDEQRLAVSLVLVEGLSYQEAADVLEVPIGTLTSRLARGRPQARRAAAATGRVRPGRRCRDP